MKRLNKMCLNCSELNNGCTGTHIQCYTGCVYRPNGLLYINSNRDKNTLYSYDLYNDLTHDEKTGNEYFVVIITKWTDATATAHEIAHKRFYFTSNDIKCLRGYNGRGYSVAISSYLWNNGANNDARLAEIFNKPENSKIFIEYTKNEFYTVNGKTYKNI